MAAKPRRSHRNGNNTLFRRKRSATGGKVEPRDRMAKATADVNEWLDYMSWRKLEADRTLNDLGRRGANRWQNRDE